LQNAFPGKTVQFAPGLREKGEMSQSDKIMWLMSAFDKPNSSFLECYYRGDPSTWTPSTEEEKLAFSKLTAPENRHALKEWFSRSPAINPGAEAFKVILERAIGEKLPLAAE
jgi:hypothetical protein